MSTLRVVLRSPVDQGSTSVGGRASAVDRPRAACSDRASGGRNERPPDVFARSPAADSPAPRIRGATCWRTSLCSPRRHIDRPHGGATALATGRIAGDFLRHLRSVCHDRDGVPQWLRRGCAAVVIQAPSRNSDCRASTLPPRRALLPQLAPAPDASAARGRALSYSPPRRSARSSKRSTASATHREVPPHSSPCLAQLSVPL